MKHQPSLLTLALGVMALSAPLSSAHAQQAEPRRAPDVPFVPTTEPVVDAMLQMAGVGPGDTVMDLGSGDGRIVIRAASQYGARGVGVDINPERIQEANANAQAAGVQERVEFREGDLFEADLSGATVVTLYLLPSVNEKLMPKLLRELPPGTRVVSHASDMPAGEPVQTREVEGTTVYRWHVPERQNEAPR